MPSQIDFSRWPAPNPTVRRERDADGKNFAEILAEELVIEADTLAALAEL